MSAELDRYLWLERMLLGCSDEDALLDEMDRAWLELGDEEREWLNSRG